MNQVSRYAARVGTGLMAAMVAIVFASFALIFAASWLAGGVAGGVFGLIWPSCQAGFQRARRASSDISGWR